MIDFVDRFDRIFSFYLVFCMVLKWATFFIGWGKNQRR
ncbi:putative membrane protein [Escherichia coli 5-366-08_S3_C2]|nr:putative membrane protein [Escherichia coli 5-366-08_S3_C2]